MHQSRDYNYASVNLIEIDADSENRRLDNFLISILQGVPHSHIYNLIRTGQVRVNSGRAKAGRRLKSGDRVRVPPVITRKKEFVGEISPKLKSAVQQILFEDECLIVLDKPAGIAVHSGTRHNFGLIEAMKMMRKNEPGIELVHRLDKDTSGVLILAKNSRSLRFLQAQWRREGDSHSLSKHYLALLKDRWEDPLERCVETALINHSTNSGKHQSATAAVSYFSAVRNFRSCVLVSIELLTGKTHQARQHALHIGQPIAGDRKYGDRDFNRLMQAMGLKRMFLHASRVSIIHPISKQQVMFESELPADLTAVIKQLDSQEEVFE